MVPLGILVSRKHFKVRLMTFCRSVQKNYSFSLDNLLRAGVCVADHVVLVRDGFTAAEEHLADCNTIVTVQTIHR